MDILNYALTLEYLEKALLRGGARRAWHSAQVGQVQPRPDHRGPGAPRIRRRIRSSAYDRLSDIRDHEVTHVDFLLGQLGSAAVGPCTIDFSSALASVSSFLKTSQVLENTGVMAYDGAIRYVDAGDVLQAGAQIATVEARHASV